MHFFPVKSTDTAVSPARAVCVDLRRGTSVGRSVGRSIAWSVSGSLPGWARLGRERFCARGIMGACMWFSLVPLVIGVALQLGFTPLHKGAAELPPHLLHHHLLGVPDMLDPKTSAGNSAAAAIPLTSISRPASQPTPPRPRANNARSFGPRQTARIVPNQHGRGWQEWLVLQPAARAHR